MPPSSIANAASARHVCIQCRTRLLFRPAIQTFSSSSHCPQPLQSTKPRLSSTTDTTADDTKDTDPPKPRWMQTPKGMKQPYSPRVPNRNNNFVVNDDPVKLDRAISRMLGTNSSNTSDSTGAVLDEEVKWLAVTHKSFDQGRRGFNDRLAFLGKRITELQTSLALLDAPQPSIPAKQDPFHRSIEEDQPLSGIENVTSRLVARSIDKARLAELAERYGLDKVIRWKPRQVHRLKSSGMETVLAHTIYAIIGAVALRKGGKVAADIVRLRVLRPLGVLPG